MQFLENSHSRLTKNRQNLFLTLLATIISFCLTAQPCLARPVELSNAKSTVEVVLEACDSDSDCQECDSFDGGKTAAKRPWVTRIGPKTVSSCSSKAEGYSYASTKQVYSWADNAGEKDPKDSEGMSFATSGGTFKSPKGYGTLVLN